MDSSNSNGGNDAGPSQPLSPQSLNLFGEGISLVLSRWSVLQMAIENQWAGRDSLQKYNDLASSILSWFTQSRGQGQVFFFFLPPNETKREVFIFFSIGLLLFDFCFFYLLEPLYIDDLENILDEILTFSLNAVVEDNSIEEVPYFLIEGPI